MRIHPHHHGHRKRMEVEGCIRCRRRRRHRGDRKRKGRYSQSRRREEEDRRCHRPIDADWQAGLHLRLCAERLLDEERAKGDEQGSHWKVHQQYSHLHDILDVVVFSACPAVLVGARPRDFQVVLPLSSMASQRTETSRPVGLRNI